MLTRPIPQLSNQNSLQYLYIVYIYKYCFCQIFKLIVFNMMNFFKHIFKEHKYLVFAVLAMIVIFSASPHQDISVVPNISAATAARVANIGKVYFEGVGPGDLSLGGNYEGQKKATYSIVINDEVNGTKNFKWNKDNGPYVDNPLTGKEYELPGGIIIKFDPKLSYKPGDNWTINAGIPAKFNVAEAVAVKTGRQIATLYSSFSNGTNQLASYVGNLFSPQSNLALKQAIGVGSLAAIQDNNRGQSTMLGAGDTALFDIEIVPTEIKSESKILPAIILILIALSITLLVIYVIRIIKKRAPAKNKI